MNKKILNVLNTTAGQLIFALAAGFAYFMAVFKVIISWSSGQSLLAVWFAPVIVCGAAIVIIKHMKQARENENNRTILTIFWLHLILLAVSAITLFTA